MASPVSDDGLFPVLDELVPPREIKAATVTSIDFDGLLSTPLLLHEDLAKGCGGQLWPAGVRLAKYLLRNKRDELGDCSMYAISSLLLPEATNRASGSNSVLEED